MSAKPKPKRADGALNALQTTLHLSKRRVSALLADGMPDDPQQALAWREERQQGDNTAQQLRAERIRLVKEQRQKYAIENAVRRGELVSAGEVKDSCYRIFCEARAEFTRFSSDLPPKLEGLPAAAIGKVLREEIRDLLSRLSDSLGRAKYLHEETPSTPNKTKS